MNKDRTIKFNFSDGKSKYIKIGKVVKSKGNRNVMYFDKVSNDTWRIIVSEDLVPEINDLDNIEFNSN